MKLLRQIFRYWIKKPLWKTLGDNIVYLIFLIAITAGHKIAAAILHLSERTKAILDGIADYGIIVVSGIAMIELIIRIMIIVANNIRNNSD